MPIFTFYGWRKQATTKFSFFSLNFSAVRKKSTPGKFAYFRHIQRTGINAIKFEQTLIHFKSNVFAAVAVADAKTPYWLFFVDVIIMMIIINLWTKASNTSRRFQRVKNNRESYEKVTPKLLAGSTN